MEDYDYEAARAAGAQPDARGHWPDTYKRPNHITFSNESIYHNRDTQGGQWTQSGGQWSFTPGPENLKHYSPDELQSYFREYEPDSKLIMPGNRQGGRIHVGKAGGGRAKRGLTHRWG